MRGVGSVPVDIRALEESDGAAFWALRLEGHEVDPRAFKASAAEHRQTTPADFISALRPCPGGDFTLGAFLEGELVGIAGLRRETLSQRAHQAGVWGVYVKETARGRSVGRRLLEALIARAHGCPGLEQLALTVSESQHAACALYLSLGFTSWGLEPRSLKVAGEYVAEHHLVLRLTGGTQRL